MQRRPEHQRKPDPEVVNLKDLAPSERQNKDTEQLGHRDAREHGRANIDQRCPSSGGLAAVREQAWRPLHDRRRRHGKGACDVRAELDADADADDDVDQTDCVEGDAGERHGADDVDDDH